MFLQRNWIFEVSENDSRGPRGPRKSTTRGGISRVPGFGDISEARGRKHLYYRLKFLRHVSEGNGFFSMRRQNLAYIYIRMVTKMMFQTVEIMCWEGVWTQKWKAAEPYIEVFAHWRSGLAPCKK